MIINGADGTEGSVSTPMQLTARSFSQGIIYTKGWPPRSVTFVENGDVTMAPGLTAEPRKSDLIATYSAPIMYCFRGSDGRNYDTSNGGSDFEHLRTKYFDKALKLLQEIYGRRFRRGNGFIENKDRKEVDVRMESINFVDNNEIVMYADRKDVVIEMDKIFKGNLDDEFQDRLTDLLTNISYVPYPKQIGYGLMREGWKTMRRPNTYMRIAGRTVLQARKTQVEFLKAEWITEAAYMYLLALALREWVGQQTIPAYEIDDWLAYAHIIVGRLSGYGSTDRTQHWTASDIAVSLNAMPGIGWTKANTFSWGLENTFEEFRQYWIFCTLLAFCCQRVKVPMMSFEIKKKISTNDWLIAQRFEKALKPNISGFGSDGTFFYLMPRNNFAYGEVNDIPFPCYVDDMKLETDVDMLKEANNYEDLPPYETVSWKDVTVDRGEVPSGAVDLKSLTQQYVRLHCTTDSRIVEITDNTTQFVRNLIQYRFPIDHIVEKGYTRDERMRLWLWGLLANADKGMKNAYIIDSSLDVFRPVTVNYRRGRMDSTIIDKTDSDARGDQIAKPGTIPIPAASISNVEAVTSVVPPKPVAKMRDTVRTVETADGKEVPSEPTEQVGNVNAEEGQKPETG